MSTETTRSRHYEDWSTPELEAKLDRLLAQQESLRKELEAVLGPDPEGPVLWDRLQGQINYVRNLLHPMKAFVGGAVAPWPAGEERLHLYALPDLTGALAAELNRQAPTLAAHSGLVAAVPDKWLHITIGRVEQATESEAEALAKALSQRVNRLVDAPVTAMMHPVVTKHGVLLDEDRDHRGVWVYGLQRFLNAGAQGAGITAVFANNGRVRLAGPPHLATAYCRAAGLGRALADRIGRGAPAVEVRVRELALVWVTQDPAKPAYTWRTVATWPLPAGQ